MKKITGSIVLGCLFIVLATFSAVGAQQEPQFTGTINVNSHVKADYLSMVGITMDQAMVFATSYMPGEVLGCELEAENGYLVYSVEIVKADDKKIAEIFVDAGNGQVLAVEFDSANDKDGEFQEGSQNETQDKD